MRVILFLTVLLSATLVRAQSDTTAVEGAVDSPSPVIVAPPAVDKDPGTSLATIPPADTLDWRDRHSPSKATLLSAVIPGAGQIYNRKYWKAPIAWAGLGISLYFIQDNQTQYRRYKDAYLAVIDGDPALHFIHVVLPHAPWFATPWGTSLMQPMPEWEDDLGGDDDAAWSNLIRFQRHSLQTGAADVGRAADHLAHMAEVAGFGAVALGSDFDGVPSLPVGMEDATLLPYITYGLLKRGHGEADVRKVLGGNALRVLADAERIGAGLRAGR